MNEPTMAVGAPTIQIQRYWLQKVGTSQVFQYNEHLAARKDMRPVSHEDAMQLRKFEEQRVVNEAEQRRLTQHAAYTAKAQQHANSFNGVVGAISPVTPGAALPAGVPTAPKTLDSMNHTELIQEAIRHNILTDGDPELLRATLKALTGQVGVSSLPMLQPGIPATEPVPATLTLQPGPPTPEIPVAAATPAPVPQAVVPPPQAVAPVAPVAQPALDIDTMKRPAMLKLIRETPALAGVPKVGTNPEMRKNIKAVLSAGAQG